MLNVRMEKRTSELESTSIEIIYFTEQRGKRRVKKKLNRFRNLSGWAHTSMKSQKKR